MKVRVPVFGTVGRSVVIDLNPRAIFGQNIYDADGKLVDLGDLLSGADSAGPTLDTSDDLDEGAYNLYFTDTRAVAAVVSALGASADITLSYDAGTNTIKATLKPTGVTAGTYGDATHIPQISVDANGRVTAVALQPFSTGGVPLVIADGATFVVADNQQILWAGQHEMLGDSALAIDGAFEEAV